MIRLYADETGVLRFAGKDPEAERLAARAIRAEKRAFEDRLFAANLALLGATGDPTATNHGTHVVGDESEEELWRAWLAYSTSLPRLEVGAGSG